MALISVENMTLVSPIVLAIFTRTNTQAACCYSASPVFSQRNLTWLGKAWIVALSRTQRCHSQQGACRQEKCFMCRCLIRYAFGWTLGCLRWLLFTWLEDAQACDLPTYTMTNVMSVPASVFWGVCRVHRGDFYILLRRRFKLGSLNYYLLFYFDL